MGHDCTSIIIRIRKTKERNESERDRGRREIWVSRRTWLYATIVVDEMLQMLVKLFPTHRKGNTLQILFDAATNDIPENMHSINCTHSSLRKEQKSS